MVTRTTRTIPREQWKRIFDSLSRIYEGSTSTLEILSPDLGAQHEVEELPFLGIKYDANGLELQFETKDGRIHVHNEPRPKLIQIEENSEGLVDSMAIESDGNPRAVLRLHSPVHWKLLTDGKGE